jgi:hypothetical protein
VNGQIQDVWNHRPSDDKLAEESGWREAVEIVPETVPNREVITTHYIDIDVEPAQILWSKRELEVEERKEVLRSQAKELFKAVINAEVLKGVDEWPETQYDAATVEAARVLFEARMNEINDAATHDAVDKLGG